MDAMSSPTPLSPSNRQQGLANGIRFNFRSPSDIQPQSKRGAQPSLTTYSGQAKDKKDRAMMMPSASDPLIAAMNEAYGLYDDDNGDEGDGRGTARHGETNKADYLDRIMGLQSTTNTAVKKQPKRATYGLDLCLSPLSNQSALPPPPATSFVATTQAMAGRMRPVTSSGPLSRLAPGVVQRPVGTAPTNIGKPVATAVTATTTSMARTDTLARMGLNQTRAWTDVPKTMSVADSVKVSETQTHPSAETGTAVPQTATILVPSIAATVAPSATASSPILSDSSHSETARPRDQTTTEPRKRLPLILQAILAALAAAIIVGLAIMLFKPPFVLQRARAAGLEHDEVFLGNLDPVRLMIACLVVAGLAASVYIATSIYVNRQARDTVGCASDGGPSAPPVVVSSRQ